MSDSGIVDDYAASLQELTFNLRPIIDNLTTIAKENTNVADGILAVISARIYKCIPEQKLFSLYLLDSICKTVGNPYNVLIGDEIFKLFSHVYLLVNDTIRNKMNNLFETWKLTKAKGTSLPLFPKEQLDKIETFLTQSGYKKKFNNVSGGLSNGSLISDIDSLLVIFENKLINNPDPKLVDRYNALKQLKTLLSNQSMQPKELQAVQTQLASIKQQELSTSTNQVLTPTSSGPTPSTTPALNYSELNEQKFLSSQSQVNELFNVLVISGLVKVDQSLKPGSKPKYEVVVPKNKYKPAANTGVLTTNQLQELLVSAATANKSEYEQLKYSEFLKLSKKLKSTDSEPEKFNSDLQNFINNNTLDSSNVQLLYDCKSSKCGTCGKRFTTDATGTDRKRLHLDWHFRINKKLTTSKSNVQSRNWYLDDYDWVKFRDDNLLEYATQTKEDPTAAEKEQNEPVSFIVVPPNETNMNNMCTICRETIKATYNDDIGEWCWYGCVKAPNDRLGRKIIHQACFKEANKKREAPDELSGRLKRERI